MIPKIRRFVISILILFFGLLVVNAEDAIIDNQTTNDRVLECDSTAQTVTRFKYPKVGDDEEIFSNNLCTIRCNESIITAIDPIKNVRAGMGFNYPLYIAAERNCVAEYDYVTYYTDLKDLVSRRDAEAVGSAAYNNLVNQISNMMQEKTTCDLFNEEDGKYELNPTISLDVETSEGVDNVTYTYLETSEYEPNLIEEKAPYDTCELTAPTAACTTETEATSGWTNISRYDGMYVMANRFIELYTGKVVLVEDANTCIAGNIYFTSFYEVTRPVTGDLLDKGYSLTLNVSNLGNNIDLTSDTWNLTASCYYTVQNLIFPQGIVTEENYPKYGSTAFMYRLIDLNTPFPNREAGENWYGKESLITSLDPTKIMYEINLSSGAIRRIRDYNDTNPYDTFNLDEMERSLFIESNPNIIKRVISG